MALSPEDRAETRRATWLVAACALVALVIYSVVSGVMTDDAYLTRMGRTKELHFILRDIRELDREAQHGDAPITWIIGSSVTRDAFDAEAVEARMHEAGSHHDVVKLAFNRGAPLFADIILEDLPVREGDRVVTSISEDNFRADWLANSGDFTLYVQSTMTPPEVMSLHEESLATRIEWALASFPPGYYARNRDPWRRGLVREMDVLVGLKAPREPKQNVSFQPFRDTEYSSKRPNTRMWTFPADELKIEPGQPNFDGLEALKREVAARGADLIVVYVPGRPQLYEKVLEPSIIQRFHDHFDATLPELHRLRPRKAEAYQDLKHVNNLGRPGFSAELADVLIRDEGLVPPPREPDDTVAPVTPETERVWVGVEP